MNRSGTNESSAKYAIIAARCVPRSAKNFWAIARLRMRLCIAGEYLSARPERGHCVSLGCRMSADSALADLIEISSQVEGAVLRSEEHTSELQSRGHLVCRLLLEKKKY